MTIDELTHLLGLEKEWTKNNAGVITQFSKVLEERNKEIEELKDKYRWRDVKDELPEALDAALAVDSEGITSAVLVREGFAFDYTHWMPLPEKEV